jgi:hypothetical protein
MVASSEGEGPRVKRSPINLYDREFVYTLPSGETFTVSPHKGPKGLVTVPEGTAVRVVKLNQTNEAIDDARTKD